MSCPKQINAPHERSLESGWYCSKGQLCYPCWPPSSTDVWALRLTLIEGPSCKGKKTKGQEIAGIWGPDSKWSTPKKWTNTQTHSNQWFTHLQPKSREASSKKFQYFSRWKICISDHFSQKIEALHFRSFQIEASNKFSIQLSQLSQFHAKYLDHLWDFSQPWLKAMADSEGAWLSTLPSPLDN